MTAADQPTTEPSEAREALASVIAAHQFAGLAGRSHDDPGGIRWACGCGHEERIDGMAGYPSWRAAHALHAADELLTALAPQPAADTETEVEWGLRFESVDSTTVEHKLRSEREARFLAPRMPGVVLRRTGPDAPWEEA